MKELDGETFECQQVLVGEQNLRAKYNFLILSAKQNKQRSSVCDAMLYTICGCGCDTSNLISAPKLFSGEI